METEVTSALVIAPKGKLMEDEMLILNFQTQTFEVIKRNSEYCVFCGHQIKSMTDPHVTRQDTMAFTRLGKTVCGACGDEIKNP